MNAYTDLCAHEWLDATKRVRAERLTLLRGWRAIRHVANPRLRAKLALALRTDWVAPCDARRLRVWAKRLAKGASDLASVPAHHMTRRAQDARDMQIAELQDKARLYEAAAQLAERDA